MTTLYKKVGRRYKPVAEHEELDSYPEGAHLVVCRPGSTMRRFNIDPDRAGLLAAAAPDLLEALQWYEAKAVQMGRAAIDQDSKLLLELMKEIAVEYGARARAAIAKATGDQS